LVKGITFKTSQQYNTNSSIPYRLLDLEPLWVATYSIAI
jgi:hypothetical protein